MEKLGGSPFEKPEQPAEQPDGEGETTDALIVPTDSQSILSKAAISYRRRVLEFLPGMRREHVPPKLLGKYDRIKGNPTQETEGGSNPTKP